MRHGPTPRTRTIGPVAVNGGRVEFQLSGRPPLLNVPLLRHAMAGFLEGQAVTGETAADVLLAVTEACTNVVQHANRSRLAKIERHIELDAESSASILQVAGAISAVALRRASTALGWAWDYRSSPR